MNRTRGGFVGRTRPFKSAQRILGQEIDQAEVELRRPALGLFLSGILAGICVGFSVLLLVTVNGALRGRRFGSARKALDRNGLYASG